MQEDRSKRNAAEAKNKEAGTNDADPNRRAKQLPNDGQVQLVDKEKPIGSSRSSQDDQSPRSIIANTEKQFIPAPGQDPQSAVSDVKRKKFYWRRLQSFFSPSKTFTRSQEHQEERRQLGLPQSISTGSIQVEGAAGFSGLNRNQSTGKNFNSIGNLSRIRTQRRDRETKPNKDESGVEEKNSAYGHVSNVRVVPRRRTLPWFRRGESNCVKPVEEPMERKGLPSSSSALQNTLLRNGMRTQEQQESLQEKKASDSVQESKPDVNDEPPKPSKTCPSGDSAHDEPTPLSLDIDEHSVSFRPCRGPVIETDKPAKASNSDPPPKASPSNDLSVGDGAISRKQNTQTSGEGNPSSDIDHFRIKSFKLLRNRPSDVNSDAHDEDQESPWGIKAAELDPETLKSPSRNFRVPTLGSGVLSTRLGRKVDKAEPRDSIASTESDIEHTGWPSPVVEMMHDEFLDFTVGSMRPSGRQPGKNRKTAPL